MRQILADGQVPADGSDGYTLIFFIPLISFIREETVSTSLSTSWGDKSMIPEEFSPRKQRDIFSPLGAARSSVMRTSLIAPEVSSRTIPSSFVFLILTCMPPPPIGTIDCPLAWGFLSFYVIYLQDLRRCSAKSSPARYELRTKGPDATEANPFSLPASSYFLNTSGVTYSFTG